MQYQVQEILRTERIFEAGEIEAELEAYNPLIPDGANWKATFMIEFDDEDERRAALGPPGRHRGSGLGPGRGLEPRMGRCGRRSRADHRREDLVGSFPALRASPGARRGGARRRSHLPRHRPSRVLARRRPRPRGGTGFAGRGPRRLLTGEEARFRAARGVRQPPRRPGASDRLGVRFTVPRFQVRNGPRRPRAGIRCAGPRPASPALRGGRDRTYTRRVRQGGGNVRLRHAEDRRHHPGHGRGGGLRISAPAPHSRRPRRDHRRRLREPVRHREDPRAARSRPAHPRPVRPLGRPARQWRSRGVDLLQPAGDEAHLPASRADHRTLHRDHHPQHRRRGAARRVRRVAGPGPSWIGRRWCSRCSGSRFRFS